MQTLKVRISKSWKRPSRNARRAWVFRHPPPSSFPTNWENKWFSKMQRDSTFIMKWITYKSDPPPRSKDKYYGYYKGL